MEHKVRPGASSTKAGLASLRAFSVPAGTANVVSQTVVSDNDIHVVELTLRKETSDALDTGVPSLAGAK